MYDVYMNVCDEYMNTRPTSLSVIGNCELRVQYAADIIISIKYISPDIYFAETFCIVMYPLGIQ